ncbi:IMP cyclohydrolase [Candidatus Woesearchaeota archaeon]|nr:IMP cyclohydrolase [Candidatus Woesearchaeota archaeon]
MNKDYKKSYKTIVTDHFPETLKVSLGGREITYRKKLWNLGNETVGLRYGENPGQEAALYEAENASLVLGECTYVYGDPLVSGISESDILQVGKHPSMNNLTDVDAALNILRYFDRPTAVIIKHNNPSGVASRESIADAYTEANLCDSIAAFGGVAVFNRDVDRETALRIEKNYLEVVCAPGFDEDALELLKQKKNLRIIRIGNIANLKKFSRFIDFRPLMDGGLILQQSLLNTVKSTSDLAVATSTFEGKEHAIKRKPDEAEYRDLIFAWRVQQGVTSNSVIFVKDESTVAIGTGEQDRVGVAKIAAFKAYEKYAARLSLEKYATPYWLLDSAEKKSLIDKEVENAKGNISGSVMSSDGFFPFADTVEVAARYGVTAIVQPGGSLRDHESIEACNNHNISMVFTGQRAFKH